MQRTPVQLVEETLIAMVLSGQIDGLLPTMRDLADSVGATTKTVESAIAAVARAGYLRQLPNRRYEPSTPSRVADRRLTELARELVAAGKEDGASYDDLRHLIAAHMVVADLATDSDAPLRQLFRSVLGRLQEESSRPRPPRTHRDGDEPSSWSSQQAAVNRNALLDDHGWA